MRIYARGVVTGDHEPAPVGLKLIATTEQPIYANFQLTLLDLQGRSLNERIVHVAEVNGAHRTSSYYKESDLRYCLLNMAFHVERIVSLYGDITRLFHTQTPPQAATAGNMSDPRVYYEVDAFLDTGRRFYEQLLAVIWKHYGGNGGRPKSFTALLKPAHMMLVPEPFRSTLEASWTQAGATLRDYRNCVSHNDPLNNGGTTCWLMPVDNQWRVTVPLPANPEAKSRSAYDFAAGPDSLDYCHGILNHLTEVAEACTALPKVRHHLDHPTFSVP